MVRVNLTRNCRTRGRVRRRPGRACSPTSEFGLKSSGTETKNALQRFNFFCSRKKAQKSQRGGAATKGLRDANTTDLPEVCPERIVCQRNECQRNGISIIPLTLIPLTLCSAALLEFLRRTRRSWEIALQSF